MGNLGIRTLRLARDRRSWSFTRARCETKEKKKSATEVLPPAAADCACAIRLDEGKESERETTNCPPKRVRSTPGTSARSKGSDECYVFEWIAMSWSDDGDKNGKIMEGTSVNVTVDPGWELCESTDPAKVIRAVRVCSVNGKEN
jgi:hypothetical protein